MTGAPTAICRVHELAEAGAFFTQDVEGTPVLVARDAAGTIRAFVNLCRHQGARLVHERQGVTASFTCILHGWNYDGRGEMGGGVLARLAESNPMLATIRAQNALTPLPIELRHGFVWVMTKPRDAIDVAAFLGEHDATLAALEHHVVRERQEHAFPASVGLRAALASRSGVCAVSETQAFAFEGDAVTQFTLFRRRAEGDFGEDTGGAEATLTLARTTLLPP